NGFAVFKRSANQKTGIRAKRLECLHTVDTRFSVKVNIGQNHIQLKVGNGFDSLICLMKNRFTTKTLAFVKQVFHSRCQLQIVFYDAYLNFHSTKINAIVIPSLRRKYDFSVLLYQLLQIYCKGSGYSVVAFCVEGTAYGGHPA